MQGNFQFLIGVDTLPQAATITLSSSAITPASQAGPVDVQPIDGPTNTLTITRNSDGQNLLTVTFTGTSPGSTVTLMGLSRRTPRPRTQ